MNTPISFVTNKLSCSHYHLNDNPWLQIIMYTCIYYLINISIVIANTIYLDTIKNIINISKNKTKQRKTTKTQKQKQIPPNNNTSTTTLQAPPPPATPKKGKKDRTKKNKQKINKQIKRPLNKSLS